MKRLLICLAASLAAAASHCAALDIAVKGKAPEYTIVIAKDAHPAFQSAAKEFADFVEQITGVRLPQADDLAPLPAKAVLIGPNRHSAALLGDKYNLNDIDMDSFLLKTVGMHLVVLGNKRGGQYGVYELLERFGGCRWYASWHSVIPKADKFSVPSDLDEFQKPAFFMRESFWFDMFRRMQALRNKCNGDHHYLDEAHGGRISFGKGMMNHTFERLMPAGEFFAEHPEYYCEINGKRTKDNWQPCLSNPDVLRIVTERTLAAIRRDPTATLFSVSQNDNQNVCQCANCKALKEKYGTESGVMIWFVNQVAEAVEKEFPNALIETLAYQFTRTPPKNIKPRHNVVPRLCTIELDFAHPITESTYIENIKFRNDIKTWASISKNLFVWDYVTNFRHYVGPFPNFNALQSNVQFFRDNHVIGLTEQGNYQSDHADFAELKGWIIAKLLWNPDADVMALLDDFMKGYYGKAAPFVRQYFDELNERVKAPEIRLEINTSMAANFLSEDFLAHAQELWEAAIDAVNDDPVYLYNVKKGAMAVYYAQLARLGKITPEYEWKDDRITFDAKTKRVGELAIKFLDCYAPVEGRNVKIAEGLDLMNGKFLDYCRSFIPDRPAKTVKADGLKLTIAPELGLFAGVFAGADGYNYLSPRLGGLSFSIDRQEGSDSGFRLSGSNESGFNFNKHFDKNARMSCGLSIVEGTLVVNYGACDWEQPISDVRCFSVGLNLGNESNVCWRTGKGEWQECTVPQRQLAGFFRLQPLADGKNSYIEIASPKTGRGMHIRFPLEIPEMMSMAVYPQTGDILIKVFLPKEVPAAKDEYLTMLMKPRADVEGLPPPKPFLKSNKARILLEDKDLSIEHYGRWGRHCIDLKAGDGNAAWLFNSHYEWCLRADVDVSKLTPDVEYALRFRVRVDKKLEKGESFWAGVYSNTRSIDVGRISPKVEDMDEEYHWYTVAKWVPDPKESLLIWAGPGRFGKEGTAINAVYFDCMELIPVDELP